MSTEVKPRWSVPPNWAWATLSQLGDVVGGGTPSTKEPLYWGDEINWISPSDLTGYSSKTIKNGRKGISRLGLDNSSAKVMPAGSVHFSSRAPIGHVVISSEPTATNQGFKSLVPAAGILNAYVYYYLIASREYALRRASGTTFLELSGKGFGELAIPVAPTNVQHAIVSKIEELFSELDTGIESLKKARAQLATYHQSVLKHAFEGQFTAQWREENKDRQETSEQLLARLKQQLETCYEQQFRDWRTAITAWDERGRRGGKPRTPKRRPADTGLSRDVLSTLPNLPDSWAWGKLAWMTCSVEYGTAAKSAPTGEVPVLRMGNIRGGRFDWSDLVYTSDHDEVAKYLLHDGDVLFNRTNSPELVGKTAIYKGSGPAIFAGYLIRINHILSIVDGQYVNLFLNSRIARHYGNSVKTDGVNQSNINGAKLLNYPFPYCSIEEQRKIVNTLDKVLSVVDKMENEIAGQLDSADALRQAILKRAFLGQLVPQDPSDEPASILVARIRAERERITRGTTRRKRAKVTA